MISNDSAMFHMPPKEILIFWQWRSHCIQIYQVLIRLRFLMTRCRYLENKN